MERPITFTNRNGARLFGMVYEPDVEMSRRVGVIISVNAIKYRLGTFRLHVMLARRMCALGYTVLTFDPEGVGDSEGEFDYKLLSEHYFDIQTGKYSRDLDDAVVFFRKECALEGLYLFGLCGGAISVLMQAATDMRVDGLILLNLPILLEDLKRLGDNNAAAKITSSEKASEMLAGKMRQLTRAEFWRRLVLLQVNFREEVELVHRSTMVLMQKGFVRLQRLFGRTHTQVDARAPVSKHPLFNMHFQRAFFDAMRVRKQVLFVFAELDPWAWIFRSEFEEHVFVPGHAYKKDCQLETIMGANHIFSGRESQEQLARLVMTWLAERAPVVPRAANPLAPAAISA